jgi:nicotinamide-nucleotide amidase
LKGGEMRAAILSIGSELMDGFLTDTNATFLTQELNALGVEPVSVTQVGDNLPRIVTAFRRALDDADVVIATGGIGPTDDDLTREAVAEVRGESVSVDPQLVETIRRFFRSRGVPMPEQNQKQAWLIPSAVALDNPMGTAPGWFVRHDERMIVLMPGVPREMYRMWREQAAPRVVERMQGRAIVSRTLKTIGVGESQVEQDIIDIVRRGYPTVATYAKDDGVHVRITAIASEREAADEAVSRTEQEIRARVGRHVYGYLDDDIASVILGLIAERGQRLALWEAGNAGRLASLLEENDLSDDVIIDARSTGYRPALMTTHTSDTPIDVARACSADARQRAGADFGVSVVVKLSAGDVADRAGGEVALALASPEGVTSREHIVRASPPEIRRRATMWAVDFLWTTLRDETRRRTG